MDNYQLGNKTWEMLLSLGTVKTFKAGEVIYSQGEKNIGLVCLKSGQIKNSILMFDGTEKQLILLEAPSLTAETSVVDNGETVCSAIAITETTVSIIPQEKAHEILFHNPDLMNLTLRILARKMRSMLLQVEGVVTTVPQRLAQMLITFESYGVYTQENHDNRLFLTHNEMARFLGTTRPKITEFLSEFAKMGLIERGRGYITILNKQKLEEIREHGLKVRC